MEDSDYGNYNLFNIRYAEGAATIAQATYCIFPDSEPEDCEDVTFVVTGKLKYFENREEIVEYIEDLGGRVTGSISKKTSFILAGDNMGPAKLEKANKLGVPIMNEDEFLDLIK
jgi:BRCT domain type II-containing protein